MPSTALDRKETYLRAVLGLIGAADQIVWVVEAVPLGRLISA